MIDNKGHEHIVWTCMWCGRINAFLWDDPDFAFNRDLAASGKIYMECQFCPRQTIMERNLGGNFGQ